MLLELGADPNMRDNQNRTAFDATGKDGLFKNDVLEYYKLHKKAAPVEEKPTEVTLSRYFAH
jgi:hypothetical protein